VIFILERILLFLSELRADGVRDELQDEAPHPGKKAEHHCYPPVDEWQTSISTLKHNPCELYNDDLSSDDGEEHQQEQGISEEP